MSELTEADLQRLRQLFFPYALRKQQNIRSDPSSRFVYYTSAATATSIIQNKEVWLRNATLMNDFMEVHHGQDCLLHAWARTPAGNRLRAILQLMDDSALQLFMDTFDADQFTRQNESYLLCISEHGSQAWDEDRYGRLSMWRAYGGNTNVAFVFKSAPFIAETDALSAYTSPVLYADQLAFLIYFNEVVKNLDTNLEFLRRVGWEEVHRWLFAALRNAVLATKHPGFSEEKEWRVIYLPSDDTKHRLTKDTKIIDGIPQTIYRMPLRNIEEEGLSGIELPQLLERLLIGPTQYPGALYKSFVEQLGEVGVEAPETKVFVSGIPLRR